MQGKYAMSNSSLAPLFNLEIPGFAGTPWLEVVWRAVTRAGEISDQRIHIPEINEDWQRLHRFEYNHFFNAWMGVASRFRACGINSETFTDILKKTHGRALDEHTFQEDDALFSFFVNGLSTLESFYFSLYALGALIVTPTQGPSVPPPAQFPLLTHLVDPAHRRVSPRYITPETTRDAYDQAFPGLPLTELLGRVQGDEMYKEWSDIRNILSHRVASIGRTIQVQGPFGFFSSNEPPVSVEPWGMDFLLDVTTTTSRYTWLRETINTALEMTAAFAAQQLPYTEDQLARWIPLPPKVE